ncbi:hypothetical protein EON65_20315 [archaeon]|nr:MAG: hypothetical protein EON65_20315 [archaeon]
MSRTDSSECFKNYYDFNTIEVLFESLENQDTSEAAAEALVCGFVRDIPYHMLKIESSEKMLSTLMDLMYRAGQNVQAHLTNMLYYAIDWPKSKDFVAKVLDMGIINLINFLLKSELAAAQDATVQVVLVLLRKVFRVKDLLARKETVIKDLVQTSVIEMLAKVTLRTDFAVDGPVMWSIMEIWYLLAQDPKSHPSLFMYVSVSLIPRKSAVGGVTTTPVQRVLDVLGALNENDMRDPRHSQGILHAFNILSFVIQDEDRVNDVVNKVPRVVAITLHMIATCSHQAARDKAIDVAYLFRQHELFPESIELCGSLDKLIEALVSSVENEINPDVLNVSLDLLAFVLHSLLRRIFLANSTDIVARTRIRDYFNMVLCATGMWQRTVAYFEYQEKTLFVARLLHVLSSFKDVSFLFELHSLINQMKLMDILLEIFSLGQNSKEVEEAILLVFGSLLGSAPYFPWDLQKAVAELSAHRSNIEALHVIREAQLMANLDLGSSLRELQIELSSFSTAVATKNKTTDLHIKAQQVWSQELRWRVLIATQAAQVIRPFVLAASEQNLPIVHAVLRLMQIILRDGADEQDTFHLQQEYYSFVSVMASLDCVNVIFALDVFGLMTGFANFVVTRGLEMSCAMLQAHDNVVKTKAVETFVYCSLNGQALDYIRKYAIASLGGMMRLPAHATIPDMDSYFILMSVLLIISRLATDENTCLALIKTSAFVGVLDTLRLERMQVLCLSYDKAKEINLACLQKLDPRFKKKVPTLVEPIPSLLNMAFLIINSLSRHENCRSILLAANIIDKLFERMHELMERQLESKPLPPLIAPGSLTLALPDECVQTLYTLFAMSFKPHSTLRTAIEKDPRLIEILIYLWGVQDANISYMARVVLSRCSVVKDGQLGDNENHVCVQSSSLWMTLIRSRQLYLIYEIIDDRVDIRKEIPTIVTFDEFTDTQVKICACDAMLSIISQIDAGQIENGITKDKIREVVADLRQSGSLIQKLEFMKQVTPIADNLQREILRLSVIERKASSRFVDVPISTAIGTESPKAGRPTSAPGTPTTVSSAIAVSNDYHEKRKLLKDLAESLRTNRLVREQTMAGVAVNRTLAALSEVIDFSTEQMKARTKERTENENVEIVAAMVEVMIVVVHLYEYRNINIVFEGLTGGSIVNLQAVCNCLLALSGKKQTALLMITTPFIVTSLVDCLQLYIRKVDKKEVVDFGDLAELKVARCIFASLIALFRYGATPMIEKLSLGSYITFFTTLVHTKGQLNAALRSKPILRTQPSRSIKVEVADLQDMPVIDLNLSLLSLLTFGKPTTLESITSDGLLVNSLCSSILEECAVLIDILNQQNSGSASSTGNIFFLSKEAMSTKSEDDESTMYGGSSAGGRFHLRRSGSNLTIAVTEDEIAMEAVSKRIAILANFCRSSSAAFAISRHSSLVLRLCDVMVAVRTLSQSELLRIVLAFFERLTPCFYQEATEGVAAIINAAMSVAEASRDLRIIDQVNDIQPNVLLQI